jgi:hypothetical protein
MVHQQNRGSILVVEVEGGSRRYQYIEYPGPRIDMKKNQLRRKKIYV